MATTVKITYKKPDDSQWTFHAELPDTTTREIISGLQPNTLYDFCGIKCIDGVDQPPVYAQATTTAAGNATPVITLTGANPFLLASTDTYTEPGFTATDAESGNLTGSVVVQNLIDKRTEGPHKVKYTVTDGGGAVGSAVRTVEVTITPKVATNVPNLFGWWDFTDAATLTKPTAATVSAIQDKSGNGRHMTAASGTSHLTFNENGGLNNLPYATISNGKRLQVAAALSQPCTLFIVLKMGTFADKKLIFGQSNTQGLSSHNSPWGVPVVGFVAGTAWGTSVPQTHSTEKFIIQKHTLLNFPTSHLYKGFINYRSVDFTGAGTGNFTSLGIGATSNGANAHIHEILLYSGEVNDADSLSILKGLHEKYNDSEVLPMMVGYGDSILQGYNSTPRYAAGFFGKTAHDLGYIPYNFGVSGSTIGVEGVADTNFWGLAANAQVVRNAWLILNFGTNDNNSSTPEWKANYKKALNLFVDRGYARSKIVLVSMPYNSVNEAKGVAHLQQITEIANELGLKYADCWNAMKNGGGNTLMADNLHPTTAGHALMAEVLKAVMA